MADITPTKIDYNLRSFSDIKDGLNNYIRQYILMLLKILLKIH